MDALAELKSEKRHLDVLAHSLARLIDLPKEERESGGIASRHYELMLQQFRAMLAYQTALARRIALLIDQKNHHVKQ